MSGEPLTLFESAVPYYARYRSGYPEHELAGLCRLTGVDARHRALDIGCATGQVAIPLARYVGHVDAIDPVPAMLAEGRRTAAAAGVDNVSWLEGDSTRLATLVEPGAHLAVFAASFHWTDRSAVLQELDGLLTADGSVVVINDDLDEAEDPDWVRAIADVRQRYPRLTALPGAVTPQEQSHREVLADSPFAAVQRMTWEWSRMLTLEQAIGLQLSYSFSSPALLGDRLEDFTSDVRDAILALHPDGLVTEPLRVEVLVARRP